MGRRRRERAHRYGLAAEKIAALYLRGKGYRIVAERYRNAWGEIDLLAVKGATLAVVEVKARRSLAQCEDAVTPWKQRKITLALEGALAGGKIAGLAGGKDFSIRFDVVWIAPWRWPCHIKDAWRL